MRVNINLASRKYEDVQQFFLRWGVALVLLAGLTLLLGALSAVKYSRTVKNAEETRDTQQKIAQLQKELDDAVAYEKRPENIEVTLEKKYWNNQIIRRTVSWTQLLNDLQRIMPNRAFLESVHPELTPDNHVTLKLQIAGEKFEDALDLQKKLENSKCFHLPKILSDTPEKGTKGVPSTLRKFEIQTNYTAECTAPARVAAKEGM
jgi:type IV pilus assembly protein PilN